MQESHQILATIRDNIGKVMVGKEEAVDLVLIALISRGHVLIEDIPGIGKTTLVSTLARTLGLSYRRIQFTPDVMPSDITGFNLYNQKSGEFDFHPGVVMCQLLLADEINRTSPKTQSSLLEAMQENQVTVDGVTHALPQPFMVLATQNPVEQVGTFPLPEAQLDRFMLRIALGYPDLAEEMTIYERFAQRSPLHDLPAVVGPDEVFHLQQAVDDVFIAPAIRRYVAMIAKATRDHADLTLGASPRGALMLVLAARSRALLQSRDYVLPDDIQALAIPVLGHRLLPRAEARLRRLEVADIIRSVIDQLPVPEA